LVLPVSSTNKIYSHDIIEILLKVALNTITYYIKSQAQSAQDRGLKFEKPEFI
jgi:hypothetical protein